jgi:hypothetical protein
VSLYGTGRSEGIGAVALIAAIVFVVHALGGGVGADATVLATLRGACLPALGGMLCYRFLRSQRRSRFAAFLAGAAYGLSPWLLAIGAAPREQLAAALAPLALEAACRCDRPDQRGAWLPWAGICLALPFAAGATVVGAFAGGLAVLSLVRTMLCGDQQSGTPSWGALLRTLAVAAFVAGNLLWLDPLADWLGAPRSPTVAEVLTTHRPHAIGLDLAAMLRVPGPALLAFALLGLLRRQKHVDASTWWAMAAAGSVPTLLGAIDAFEAIAPASATATAVQAAAWWCTLFAMCVLAAAGLDDFLDLPLRRRTALPWLLAIAVAAAPLLPAFGARVPHREWPLTATLVGLPLLLTTWRRLGILRFKNWLAAAAMLALAIPALQTSVATTPPTAPVAETTAPAPWQPPAWYYTGLLLAVAFVGFDSWSAWRRRQKARPTPSAAKAAITKKATPAKCR